MMPRSTDKTGDNTGGLLVIGLGIGCLMGLSVSPVLHIVIGSLIAAAAAYIAAVSGLNRNAETDEAEDENSESNRQPLFPNHQVTTWPLAMLILGIVLGALGGILMRNYDLLGAGHSVEIDGWVAATEFEKKDIASRMFDSRYPLQQLDVEKQLNKWVGLGMGKNEALNRLFEMEYRLLESASSRAPSSETRNSAGTTTLQAQKVSADDCKLWKNDTLISVADEFEDSGNEFLIAVSQAFPEEEDLKKYVESLCK